MAAIGTSISPQAIEATIIPIGKMPVTMKEAPTSSQPMAHSEPGDDGRSRSCPETRSYRRIGTSSSKRLLADVEHEAREEASQNHPCEIDVAHPGSSYMD